MKKIILLLITVTLAVNVQAAAVSWKMGTSIKAPKADGTVGTANAGAGTLSMYVWLVDESVYNAATAESIIKDYSGDLTSANASVKSKSGSAGGTAKTDGLDFSSTSDTYYYGLVLTEYKSGDALMYAANKATAVINTAGTDATVTNLSKTWGGGANGSAVVWGTLPSENIPEPTSSLLILLGVGLMGLRRKQK